MTEPEHCAECGTRLTESPVRGDACPRCLLALAMSDPGQEERMGAGAPVRIGPYEIVGLLGAGGMGTVYRARDTDLGRDLAIKVLPDQLISSAQMVRFEREAKLLASLNHPNIATIYSIGESEGLPYLVLELIEGISLWERLENGPLPLDEALDLVRQVAEAMDVAHEAGIVHRDLKPENVMITARGLVKILDFGIAKEAEPPSVVSEGTAPTTAGTVIGTIPYMSPEQARGEVVDQQSDIWALGCLLFETLTGRSPFLASTPAVTLVAILEEEPDLEALPADTPGPIRALVADCLQKQPTRRPAAAREVHATLLESLEGRRTRAPTAWARATPGQRIAWASGAVLALAAVLALSEGSLVRELFRVMPDGVRVIMTSGSRLMAIALVLAGIALASLQLLPIGGRAPRSIGGRPLARRAVTMAGVLVGLFLLYLAGDSLAGRAQTIGSGASDVYVVLPDRAFDDEEPGELFSISAHFRSTLETVYSDVASVRIMPPAYTDEGLLSKPPLCTFQRVMEWMSGSDLPPSLVLCISVNIIRGEEQEQGLIVVSTLRRVRDGVLERIDMTNDHGAERDIGHLALRTSVKMLQTLKKEPLFALSALDEAAVMERVLEEHVNFLTLLGGTGGSASLEVDELRASGLLDSERVLGVLDAYESPVRFDEEEARTARVRDARLRQVGGVR